MRFIDELCVRRAVQRASGHGFLVGAFTSLCAAGLWCCNPLLAIMGLIAILTPLTFNKNVYLDWEVKRAKEDVR